MSELTVTSKFNAKMEEMTTKTPGHCDQWNTRYQQLLGNDQFLKDQVDKILTGSAASHNAIYRGADLKQKHTLDQIFSMIQSGTFDDIFIGDYFDVSITTSL